MGVTSNTLRRKGYFSLTISKSLPAYNSLAVPSILKPVP